MMNKLLTAVTTVAFVLLASASAYAGVIIDISGTGSGPDGSASFVASGHADFIPGGYRLTDISGTQVLNGVSSSITGLWSFGDQVLFPFISPPDLYVDIDGIAWTTSSGSFDVRWDGAVFSELFIPFGPSAGTVILDQFQASVREGSDQTEIPEPATIALFGVGAFGATWFRRRKQS